MELEIGFFSSFKSSYSGASLAHVIASSRVNVGLELPLHPVKLHNNHIYLLGLIRHWESVWIINTGKVLGAY